MDPLGYPRIVKYSLTRADLFRWQIRQLFRNRIVWAFTVIPAGATVWSVVTGEQIATRGLGFKMFAGAFAAFFIFACMAAIQLLVVLCLLFAKQHRGLLGEHELELRDEGLLERTPFNESMHRWSGFERVISTRDVLYIFVTDTMVHIVPTRAFSSAAEAARFVDEILRRTRAANKTAR